MTLSGLGGASAAHADTLTITASGTVGASCSIQPDASEANAQTFGGSQNFSTTGNATAPATVNCNKAFQISATSTNGAIKHTTITTPPTGFANTLPYSFGLNVSLDDGSSVTKTCASSSLSGQNCALSSGTKTSINKSALLSVSWTAPTSPRLLAGAYSDTITLTITPTS